MQTLVQIIYYGAALGLFCVVLHVISDATKRKR